jgi:hypothetical protein
MAGWILGKNHRHGGGFLISLICLAIARVLRYPVVVPGLGYLTAFAVSPSSAVWRDLPFFQATQIHPEESTRKP